MNGTYGAYSEVIKTILEEPGNKDLLDALTLEHGKVYDRFVREGEELKYHPDGKLMPDSAAVIQEAIDLWLCEEILNHFPRKLEVALKDLTTID